MFWGGRCWWKRSHGVLVARFGVKETFGRCELAREEPQCFGGLPWREGTLRETWAGLSAVTAFWHLERRVLLAEESPPFGGSLW